MVAHNPLALGLMLVGVFGLLFAAYLYRLQKNGKRTKEDKAFGAAFFLAKSAG